MQSTIRFALQDTFSTLSRRRFCRFPAMPNFSTDVCSHVPQKLSIDFSPLMFDPCHTCLVVLRQKEKTRFTLGMSLHGEKAVSDGNCKSLPCAVVDHVASIEAVNARRLRRHVAIRFEQILPRAKQHFTLDVGYGNVPMRVAEQTLQTLDPIRGTNEHNSSC